MARCHRRGKVISPFDICSLVATLSARPLGERTYHRRWYICAQPIKWVGKNSLPLRIRSPLLCTGFGRLLIIAVSGTLSFNFFNDLLTFSHDKSCSDNMVQFIFLKLIAFGKILYNNSTHHIFVMVLCLPIFCICFLNLIIKLCFRLVCPNSCLLQFL